MASGAPKDIFSREADLEQQRKEEAAKAEVLAKLTAGEDSNAVLARAEAARRAERERREREAAAKAAVSGTAVPAKDARAAAAAAPAPAAEPARAAALDTAPSGGLFSRVTKAVLPSRASTTAGGAAAPSAHASRSAGPSSAAAPVRGSGAATGVHTLQEMRREQEARDAALAASMQHQEAMQAQQHQHIPVARQVGVVPPAGRGVAGFGRDEEAAAWGSQGPSMEDPVWGRFSPPPGHTQFTVGQMVGLSCCPCCVPPCCSPPRKAAWRRFASSASFILAAIQLVLLIVSLCLKGFAPYSVNPMLGPPGDVLNTLQALNAAQIVYNTQLWRFVTPLFLHAGIIHYAMNMSVQLRLGVMQEYAWGLWTYLAIYFGGGIMGSALSAVANTGGVSVGASGALGGVISAWVVHLVTTWKQGDEATQASRSRQLCTAVISVVLILAFSAIPFVDWSAHVGGMIGGMLLAIWHFAQLRDGPAAADGSLTAPLTPTAGGGAQRWLAGMRSRQWTRSRVVAWVGLAAYLALLLGLMLGLFLNVNPPRYMLAY